jgi:two-component system NtrC family sensor kinase
VNKKLPPLQKELLFNLGLLTAAAVSVAFASALVSQLVTPRLAAVVLSLLVVADIAVVSVFGHYLIKKLVLRPLDALNTTTSQIAEGDLGALASEASTAEFTELAEKFNQMTAALRETQADLVRSEKLASIGRLAAGVAHEIGNPLGAVANYTSVLEGRNVEPEVVESIRDEVDRMDRIVRDMLAFARPESGDLEELSIVELVEHVAGTLERQNSDASTILVRHHGDFRSSVNKHLLEQCLLNVMVNAQQAAPEKEVEIVIEKLSYKNVPGIAIRVSDAGDGVPVEIRDKIFDPFFTTKDPGSGTGLGLAIVSRAADVHSGHVWVDDSSLGGARFNIFLPHRP